MTLAVRYNVRTDFEDWPEGLTPADKEWFVTFAKRQMALYGWCTVSQMYARARSQPSCPIAWRKHAGLDWLYAVCERALRAAELVPGSMWSNSVPAYINEAQLTRMRMAVEELFPAERLSDIERWALRRMEDREEYSVSGMMGTGRTFGSVEVKAALDELVRAKLAALQQNDRRAWRYSLTPLGLLYRERLLLEKD